jgi:vancomycin resistance protein YoaR
VQNIQRMAREVDGLIVQPGEIFDLNQRIGPRTEAKGYVPAPILLNGEGYCCDHPLNIGGGTSQFGTTIYGAIFFGGFEDITHRPHSRYISRYPLGIEATLGYPSPNVVFRNDTDFPMTVRTRYTSSSITVEMWGNNNGRTMIGSHSGGRTSTWISRSGDVTARKVTWSVSGFATYDDGGSVTVRRWLSTGGSVTSQVWTHRYIGG